MILSDVILKKNYISNMKFIYETNRNIREIWRHDSFLIRIGSETYDIKANAAEREAEREAHQKKRKFYDDYEICFVDQEGRSYDVHEDERAWCNHSYSVQGISSIHTKDGQGGCVIEEYESMKCQYCNKVKLGDRINVITYKSCPH